MTDEVDRVSEIQQKQEQRQIDQVKRLAQVPEAEETGYCLWCYEDTNPGRRWCNAECRDLWEKSKR